MEHSGSIRLKKDEQSIAVQQFQNIPDTKIDFELNNLLKEIQYEKERKAKIKNQVYTDFSLNN